MTPTLRLPYARKSQLLRALLQVLLLVLLSLSQPLVFLYEARAQGVEAQAPSAVEQLIAEMTPEQRVAQLFLVTFGGSQAPDDSLVARLVSDLRVGGVVLRASNGNYQNSGSTAAELVALTNQLQALALRSSQQGEGTGPFIPLFIAMDLFSSDALLADGLPQNGFTRVPSQMAIGATWNPANAETVGRIVGQELAAIGVNMLLGPALDVVDSAAPDQSSHLGTRTFGGSPYWVGLMGKAFVRGVAAGSTGRVATIARHFPGLGSSDRRPDEEIATVQKPLLSLQQEDLPPFYAIVNPNGPVTDTRSVDGLMTTNVRYRALQGNIRPTTRPISLDAQSLPTLLGQPELLGWRQAGGVLVSAELGAPSLRRFHQQQTGSFPARTVARDALNAGNDLLFLADFALEDDWTARLQNIEQTVQFFAEQYQSDPAFASRVDESLRRLLGLKLRLYGDDFGVAATPLPDPTTLDPSPLQTVEHVNAVSQIAREAATLL
ncbi:MAG: glycoside hydrolase family 3 N-terminal domain-containing protein, partial [Ardenticatenaceae bacterium]